MHTLIIWIASFTGLLCTLAILSWMTKIFIKRILKDLFKNFELVDNDNLVKELEKNLMMKNYDDEEKTQC